MNRVARHHQNEILSWGLSGILALSSAGFFGQIETPEAQPTVTETHDDTDPRLHRQLGLACHAWEQPQPRYGLSNPFESPFAYLKVQTIDQPQTTNLDHCASQRFIGEIEV
jgi:hypothetical protein